VVAGVSEHRFYLVDPGPRPFFGDVAYHLWGKDCDFDSDGNDDSPEPDGWTELTVTLRPGYQQRVDIDPLDDLSPRVFVIRSAHRGLAKKAALFLQREAGGNLSKSPPR
jgi:hypothetical protein